MQKQKYPIFLFFIICLSFFIINSSITHAEPHILAKDHPNVEVIGLGETMDSTYAFSLKCTAETTIKHWGNVGKHILMTTGTTDFDIIMPTDNSLSGK